MAYFSQITYCSQIVQIAYSNQIIHMAYFSQVTYTSPFTIVHSVIMWMWKHDIMVVLAGTYNWILFRINSALKAQKGYTKNLYLVLSKYCDNFETKKVNYIVLLWEGCVSLAGKREVTCHEDTFSAGARIMAKEPSPVQWRTSQVDKAQLFLQGSVLCHIIHCQIPWGEIIG